MLRHTEHISVPKALLVMPLVMHEATVRHLSDARVSHRGSAALAAQRPDLFTNFSERYDASLVASVNAIQLLVVYGYAIFNDGLSLNKPLQIDKSFGKRAEKIDKASSHIASLLSSPVDELYLNFRVKI
ncbi:DUF6521 family protein [Acidovorax sp. D4N7]|nr:DUF6521 family protein [Acidovorax sp. D4N7]